MEREGGYGAEGIKNRTGKLKESADDSPCWTRVRSNRVMDRP
jgi:hypothetical protein